MGRESRHNAAGAVAGWRTDREDVVNATFHDVDALRPLATTKSDGVVPATIGRWASYRRPLTVGVVRGGPRPGVARRECAIAATFQLAA